MSPFQSPFILERSIHDNILLTHEFMYKFKNMKTKTAWTTIKLDMEKNLLQNRVGFYLQSAHGNGLSLNVDLMD